MRKTHWEQINKREIIRLNIDHVEKCVKATSGIHKHENDFRHIDCVQNHIKPGMPEALLNETQPMLAMARTFLFYYIFKNDGARIFKIASEFGEELAKTKLNIPARVIPSDNEIICVEFPEWFKYQCVYIGCVDNPGKDSYGQVYKRLEFQFNYPLSDKDLYDRFVLHFYSEDESIEDAVDRLRDKHPEFLKGKENFLLYLKFALNCYLYIHSGKPDLREYRPPKRPLTKKPKEQRRYDKMMENMDGVPVVLVGFNFKKETHVGAHMQRYWTGKGRTELVWIYKNPYVKGGVNDSTDSIG